MSATTQNTRQIIEKNTLCLDHKNKLQKGKNIFNISMAK